MAGIIASLLAVILLYPAALWVRGATAGVYGGVDLLSYFLRHFLQIFFFLFFSGIAIGSLSSYLAIRKYLKV
jgi:cell division protein FtsX